MQANILALDAGFTKTGWCVFSKDSPIAFGIIKPEKSSKKNVRIADDRAHMAGFLASELKLIISGYHVKGCVCELPTGGALNAKAMAYMAAATGVIAAVLSVLQIPVEWTTPVDGKLALCGAKNASKEQIMSAVRDLYPSIKWPTVKTKFEDVADAIGAYHASKNGMLLRLLNGNG